MNETQNVASKYSKAILWYTILYKFQRFPHNGAYLFQVSCLYAPHIYLFCSTFLRFFFRSPSNKHTQEKWKEAIGKHQHNRDITVVCDLHFKPDEITRGTKRKLKTGAIPSIFPAQT